MWTSRCEKSLSHGNPWESASRKHSLVCHRRWAWIASVRAKNQARVSNCLGAESSVFLRQVGRGLHRPCRAPATLRYAGDGFLTSGLIPTWPCRRMLQIHCLELHGTSAWQEHRPSPTCAGLVFQHVGRNPARRNLIGRSCFGPIWP